MDWYIVRDWDNNRKYLCRTRDLKAAIRILDAHIAAGGFADLVCKHAGWGRNAQVVLVDQALVDAARAMATTGKVA